MKTNLIFILSFALLFASCTSTTDNIPEKVIQGIEIEEITRIVKTFSADSFLGRKPFTIGEEKAIDFLINEYQRIGLEPAVDGSYLQEVPMVEVTVKPQEQMVFYSDEKQLKLNNQDDFVAFSRRLQDHISIKNSELVFAGHGIVAPEYNWNDYEGLDVEGKTVIVLVNDPGFRTEDEDLFNGRSMTYYGRWTYKYEEAARQGAAALLIVHETEPAGYPWSVVLNGAIIPKLYLRAEDNYHSRCAVEGWLTKASAQQLFALNGLNLEEQIEAASNPGFKAKDLSASMSFEMESSHRFASSYNVIGKIPGTDRADEAIVYSSHWDHLGVGRAMNGDSIYNGAVDNGTTTAWMLEIAEAFTEMPEGPRRTILILSPTAEEQGLIGSSYYTQNPVIPLDKTVANINNDLMIPYGPYKDVMVTGYGQSELEDYVKKHAETQGRYILPDPNPHTGMYYRADHFPFAKAGVPALFVRGNCDNVEHGKEWALEKEKNWLENYYHKPTDEYENWWNLEGVVQDARLLFRVGYDLSMRDDFPEWKEGSEFKSKRDEMMK